MTNKVNNSYQNTSNYTQKVNDTKAQNINNETKENQVKTEDANKEKQAEAVVYEKSNPAEEIKAQNEKAKISYSEAIEKMKSDAEARYNQMIETVRQMIAKQGKEAGGKISKDFDFFKVIPKSAAELNGEVEKTESKTEETKDVEEIAKEVGDLNDPNNYWSAEQTAKRIVDFAKEISGGDSKKYALLKGAIEKGFSSASAYFDKMPDITGKTHDLVMKGLDEWAGKTEETKESETTAESKVEKTKEAK